MILLKVNMRIGISKHIIYSQNDILLYNSMKQEENELKFIPNMKRQSKDGDFAKASHSVIESFNYDEDDLSEEEEHKPPSNRAKVQNQNVYYEPKTLKNNKRLNLKEKQEFGQDMQSFKQHNSEAINKTISNNDLQNYQNTNYMDALKIPKATKARERIKSNSKFLNSNTYIEKKIDNSLGSEFKRKGSIRIKIWIILPQSYKYS